MGLEGGVHISWCSNGEQVRDCSFTGTGFGCMQEKRKFSARYISSTIDISSKIPRVCLSENNFRTKSSIFTTIQRLINLRLLFYWDRFECMREKKSFGKGRRENGFQRKREHRDVSYIVTYYVSIRVLLAFYLLYFFFLYLFYKNNSILVLIKWINKISFLFSFKPLF